MVGLQMQAAEAILEVVLQQVHHAVSNGARG